MKLRGCLLLTAGLLSLVCRSEAQQMAVFKDGARILFQGDSITDGNRGRNTDPNHILGHGYQFILSAKFGAMYPERKLTLMNRGISGNTVADLSARWQKDTVALAPDVLSVLIGINDVMHSVSADDYEQQLDRLLDDTMKQLPDVKLVLGEPFALPVGRFKNEGWEERLADLHKRQNAVNRLARKYHAAVVHYQKVFDDACRRAPADYWIWDGIHPTYSGHQLMADEWVSVVNEFRRQ